MAARAVHGREGVAAIRKPILERAPRSAAAEAFRGLRTSLQFLGDKAQMFVVTSAGPGEGKSTTAANLAVALAGVGKRVLLVDADLRRPSIHQMFRLDRARGLSHVLVGQAGDEAIQQADPDGLHVLVSGPVPPNPAELLDQAILDVCLTRWRQQFEHIVVDSPPIMAVTDPVIVARKVKSALVVVRAATTRDRSLHHACSLLREAGVELLGTALNDLPQGKSYEYAYSYAGYGVEAGRANDPS